MWLGLGLAIKKGVKVIRPFTIIIMILLFTKIVYDLIIQTIIRNREAYRNMQKHAEA